MMKAIRTSIKTLALTFAVGLFVTASPAVAASDVNIDGASLVARGAAVDVTYSFVCDPGSTISDSFVRLDQRSGRGVATGFGNPFQDPVPCTGETQTTTIRVFPENGRAFKTGIAAATVGQFICDPNICTPLQFNEQIRITK
jgi:hypothetical protein